MAKNKCGGMVAPGKTDGKTVPGSKVPPSKTSGKKRSKGEIGAYLRMKKKGGKAAPDDSAD